MIAHDGRHRDRPLHLLDPDEELRPLQAILAVVHEIPHAGKELRVRIARPSQMRELLPVRIVRGLGVREDQHLVVLILGRRIEHLPVGRRIAGRNTVLIGVARRKVKLRCVLVHVRTVIGKARILCGKATHTIRPLHAQLDHLILHRGGYLPHKDAPAPHIRRDNLPQALHVEHTRELP